LKPLFLLNHLLAALQNRFRVELQYFARTFTNVSNLFDGEKPWSSYLLFSENEIGSKWFCPKVKILHGARGWMSIPPSSGRGKKRRARGFSP
jgi:hypothetical protein